MRELQVPQLRSRKVRSRKSDEKVSRETHKLVVLDFETDPFKHGESVYPFVWDLYDGEVHTSYWGDDCLPRLIEYLKRVKQKCVIYAHNGGKFDFMFLLPWIRGKKMLVINNRIVEAELCGHIIRDSYAAIPVSLGSTGEKGKIDYETKFRKDTREKHKDEITKYLWQDTEVLYKYVAAYRSMFGHKAKTMASAAIKELKKFHRYEVMGENMDNTFREYFHGGRVECFQTGIIECSLKVYDVNSMYPSVMKNFLHPVSATPIPADTIGRKTCFVSWEGESRGAMPVKDENGSLRFPHGRGFWKCSIHEFNAGLEAGTIKVDKIIKTWDFLERASFAEFIDHYYSMRLAARAAGDDVNTLFYKLIMNSAYGKFAQNPRDFKEYQFSDISPDGRFRGPKKQCWCTNAPHCNCGGWRIACEPTSTYMMWAKPVTRHKDYGIRRGWHNCATAASITGAARSLLLRAIVQCDTPLYCDTDSLICKDLKGVEIHEKNLGAWKLEKVGSKIAIAGKKMYSIWQNGNCVKTACKGVKLTPDEIAAVASGEEVEYRSPAPQMKFDGRQVPLRRRVRKTA